MWVDDAGAPHSIIQAEGGEQGDPLMPALFALGLAPALRALQAEAVPGENIRAFLDDIYLSSSPERTAHLLQRLEVHLFEQACIRLNAAKTRVWNARGVEPPNLPPAPQSERTWVGDTSLPPDERGLRILGIPLGTDEFAAAYLQNLSAQHRALLDVLPSVPDLQVAWLLLFFCANPRAQYVLRALPPALTAAFAFEHDRSVLLCLAQLLQVDPGAGDPLPDLVARRAHVALRHGGLGLRSAASNAPEAYFASWADSLPAALSRDRALCASWLRELEAGVSNVRSLAALQGFALLLAEQGFQVPPWASLLTAPPPPATETEDEPLDLTRGWQRAASRAVDDTACAQLLPLIDPASRAMLESQAGPFAARVFTPASFRVLLLRRLRLPLPLDSVRCRCRARLDQYGDHRAACPRAGLLRSRGIPLERAAARVCREAGATVATNVLLRDLNVVVDRQDDRRLEVIANGLPLWGGVQLAVDTTLVSPLDSLGRPRSHARSFRGAALHTARLAKERTYPELLRAPRCRLVVLALELGGRWSREAADFIRLLARCRARSTPPLLRSACVAACVQRWSAALSFAAAKAFASTLLSLPLHGAADVDGQPPELSDLLQADRFTEAPVPSRLPAHG